MYKGLCRVCIYVPGDPLPTEPNPSEAKHTALHIPRNNTNNLQARAGRLPGLRAVELVWVVKEVAQVSN